MEFIKGIVGRVLSVFGGGPKRRGLVASIIGVGGAFVSWRFGVPAEDQAAAVQAACEFLNSSLVK